jgi:hypothetical protein
LIKVDPEVANHIFRNAILEFLIRRKKTVLCIVSQYNFVLSTFNQPSVSVYLVKNGVLINENSQVMAFLKREAPAESVIELKNSNSHDYFSLDVLESDKKSSMKFLIIREEEIQSGIFNQKSSSPHQKNYKYFIYN